MASVQIEKLGKAFRGQTLYRELSLDARDGEYLVVLGPSGSGKTTLLRMIAGLESVDRGEIRFDGEDVCALPPRDRDVAMVFQADRLYPHWTVRKSIAFALKRRCRKNEVDARIEHAAKLTRCDPFLDRYPSQLSGGQLRRASIAKAIACRSAVRLLDEPLSALDPAIRFQLQNELRQWHLQAAGTTIHVTHDGNEAMRVADRIAVLHDGVIQQLDLPQRVYDHPATKEVALAMGAAPINLVDCAIDDQHTVECPWPGVTLRGVRLVSGEFGTSVCIGARPEHFCCLRESAADRPGLVLGGDWMPQYQTGAIHGRVQTESASFQLILSRQVGPERASWELAGPELAGNENVASFFCPLDKLHAFAADGRRIEILGKESSQSD